MSEYIMYLNLLQDRLKDIEREQGFFKDEILGIADIELYPTAYKHLVIRHSEAKNLLEAFIKISKPKNDPVIICLCGSTKFYEEFVEWNYKLTMQGFIILSVGFYSHSSEVVHYEKFEITPGKKIKLDELHKRKIDLADEIFVLDVDGYIGDSTRSEIEYAKENNKIIHYLSSNES